MPLFGMMRDLPRKVGTSSPKIAADFTFSESPLGWTASLSNLIQMPWQGDPKAKEDAGPAAWLGKPMEIWTLKFRCSSIWFFVHGIFPMAFLLFLEISMIIPWCFHVFSLRNFFELLFSHVISRVFPIISLEPHEFSNPGSRGRATFGAVSSLAWRRGWGTPPDVKFLPNLGAWAVEDCQTLSRYMSHF